MKILYAHLYDRKFNLGGADKGVFDLVRSMKEDYGVEVHCMTNEGNLAKQFRDKGIKVTVLPEKKTQFFKTLRILKETILTYKPHLIHSHHRYTTFLLDLFFKNSAFILHTQRVTHRDKRLFFRYGHYVTAVSEGVRLNLINHYGVEPEQVLTIPNAVYLRPVDPLRMAAIEARYPREAADMLVLCNARFDEQKGHVYLIEAVRKLPSRCRHKLKIFLAGDGPLRSILEKRILKLGLDKSFIFLGYTDNIPELLHYTDFSVLPSLWEGLPRTIIEAFLMSRTVIATDIPGIQEVLNPGLNGLRVPPGDSDALAKALELLIENPAEVLRLQESAFRDSAQFSFQRMTASYYALYQEKRRGV